VVTLDANRHALIECLWIVGGIHIGRAFIYRSRHFGIGRARNHNESRSHQNSETPHEEASFRHWLMLHAAPDLRFPLVPHSKIPELTRGSDIQLLLRRRAKAASVPAPDIAATSGPSMAKPSGDYIPLGGFVFLVT
jgi:hypothetical protein